MMTRSDFVALSSALRKTRTADGAPPRVLAQWHRDIITVADAIASKTPPHIFDRARFLRDCGIDQE